MRVKTNMGTFISDRDPLALGGSLDPFFSGNSKTSSHGFISIIYRILEGLLFEQPRRKDQHESLDSETSASKSSEPFGYLAASVVLFPI